MKTGSPTKTQVPRDVWSAVRRALRATARDSRRKDRVLHDSTRTLIETAIDALDEWQDSK